MRAGRFCVTRGQCMTTPWQEADWDCLSSLRNTFSSRTSDMSAEVRFPQITSSSISDDDHIFDLSLFYSKITESFSPRRSTRDPHSFQIIHQRGCTRVGPLSSHAYQLVTIIYLSAFNATVLIAGCLTCCILATALTASLMTITSFFYLCIPIGCK